MKRIVLTMLIVLLLTSIITAGESSCPADRAAQEGYDPFGDFHEIMAPAWHNAWPEKDYDALLAAGPQFESQFKKIVELKPTFKSNTRHAQYDKNLKSFAMAVKRYAEACQKGDKDRVYELMPNLHDTFEMTASCLLPVHYPEFDGFIISFNLLYESHLPNENIDGIIGTSETLIDKMHMLSIETLPDELQENEKDILVEFDIIKEMVLKIKKAADKKAMHELKETAKALSEKIDTFVKKYI